MKKAFIVLLALAVPATLWGMDISQGKIELSGQTAFNVSDTTTERSGDPDLDETTYEFEVDGSYYFMKNLGLGLFISYEKTEQEQAGLSSDESFTAIGPQVTFNIPLNDKISAFVKGAVGYVSADLDGDKADGFAYQLGGGLKYFVTTAASVNGLIQYQRISMEDDFNADIDRSGLNFGVGLSLYF